MCLSEVGHSVVTYFHTAFSRLLWLVSAHYMGVLYHSVVDKKGIVIFRSVLS